MTTKIPQLQCIDTVVDVPVLMLRRSSCPLGQLRFLRSEPRQAEVALRRGIFAAEMRHLSASVLLDIEFRCRGRREFDSQAFCHRYSPLPLTDVEKHMGQVRPHHHHYHQTPSCPRLPGSFRGDLVSVGLSGESLC